MQAQAGHHHTRALHPIGKGIAHILYMDGSARHLRPGLLHSTRRQVKRHHPQARRHQSGRVFAGATSDF